MITARSRTAAVLIAAGVLLYLGSYAWGYAVVFGSGPGMHCRNALDGSDPRYSGFGGEATNVNLRHHLFPYGLECTFSNGERSVTVFHDLGTPGIVTGIATFIAGGLLYITPPRRRPVESVAPVNQEAPWIGVW